MYRVLPVRPTKAARATSQPNFWILSLLAALMALAPAMALAGDWKGSEENLDGVLYVKNPEAPVEAPTEIELEELWRIGGYDDEDNIFGVIVAMMVDEQEKAKIAGRFQGGGSDKMRGLFRLNDMRFACKLTGLLPLHVAVANLDLAVPCHLAQGVVEVEDDGLVALNHELR